MIPILLFLIGTSLCATPPQFDVLRDVHVSHEKDGTWSVSVSGTCEAR